MQSQTWLISKWGTMTRTVKSLVAFLIVVELTGLALLGIEAKILVDNSGESLHWLGYVGAGLMTGGALFWAKIYTTYFKR